MSRLREADAALELLAPLMATVKAPQLNWWRVDSDLDPIRDDPRFVAMLAEAEARVAAMPREAKP
jgi:hypothetical protein